MLKAGDRVRMIEMGPDPYATIPSGTEGTVTGGCEEMKVLYVKWDNGSNLSICTDVDVYEKA